MRHHRVTGVLDIVGHDPAVGRREQLIAARSAHHHRAPVRAEVGEHRHPLCQRRAAGVGDHLEEAGIALVRRHIDLADDLHVAEDGGADDDLASAVLGQALQAR
jgi:hypothetical protein